MVRKHSKIKKMKPLLVLLSVFAIGFFLKKLSKSRKIQLRFLGKLAMSCMLIFTGIAHFIFADGMAMMLPESIPFRIEIIYLTGMMEILGAMGLLINQISRQTGILLILFLIAVLPANIYAAVHQIDPTTGELNGEGVEYLFLRIPLQLFFICWIYGFAIAKRTTKYFFITIQ